MEWSLLKRAAPYFEALCFLAAWAVGIMTVVGDRGIPAPRPRERDIVSGESAITPVELPLHRSFRPIAVEESAEGG
jgi:hypothetical protein